MPHSYNSEAGLQHNAETHKHGRLKLIDLFIKRQKERLPYGDPNLPINNHLDEILNATINEQAIVVAGATGSGKSTQVPLKLLNHGIRSDMMQPRRLAADLVAQRLDYHVRDRDGDKGEGIVGCLTADKNTITDKTEVRVLTDGVLIRQLPEILAQEYPPTLIIDEVHEWKVETEIALALIRKAMTTNPNIRVILMSATPDQQVLTDLFADVLPNPLKTIEIPVAIHEIQDIAEPESTVVEQAFKYGSEGKNVLCFVEGKREIQDAIDEIRAKFRKEGGQMPAILPLHAKLPKGQQDAALRSYPNGKIIVATDVAQTSITIPDIDVVVDCGRKREPHIDDEFSESLDIVLASRSDMRQRRGRCGRVKEGIYVHTRGTDDEEFVTLDDLLRPEYSLPEIQRTEVDRVALFIASLGSDMEDLQFPHQIDQSVIEHAKEKLRILGALDENGTITTLGRKMESLPMSPVLARMVVESEQYSAKTRAQVIAITAAVEAGGLQDFGFGVGKRWKELLHQEDSDMLAQLELFTAVSSMNKHEQKGYNLDIPNVERAKVQYRKIMQRIGIDVGQLDVPTNIEVENIKRCIYAGMIDYVYEYQGDNEYLRAGGELPTLREISNRSIVRKRANTIVGFPYNYELKKKNEIIPKHIIDRVTRVDMPHVLGEIAAHLCAWKPAGTTMRSGRLVQQQDQHYRTLNLGITREVEAEINDETVTYMVDHMMSNPGTALQKLYTINKNLNALRKLSSNVPDSIHDDIKAIVTEAVIASNLDERYADQIIRDRIEADNITLETYISDDDVLQILENSPSQVERFGYNFFVEYVRGGIPVVKGFDLDKAVQFDDEVLLEDGRIVKFVGKHGKFHTVSDLKQAATQNA